MASKGDTTSQGKGRAGKPPMRPRDLNRMRDFNDKKSQESGNWNDMAETDDKHNQALKDQKRKKSAPQKQRPKGNTGKGNAVDNVRSTASVAQQTPSDQRKPWEPTDSSRRSTEETPPRDDPICEGAYRGSKPISGETCHQYEFSQFPSLVKSVFDQMEAIDTNFGRKLPFAIFQHYCFMILNAYILDYQRVVNQMDSISTWQSFYELMRLEGYVIPTPIYDYICHIGNAQTPSGERITWTIPELAVPQPPRTTEPDAEGVREEVESGSFGPLTANAHNVYECYCSPWMSMQYLVHLSVAQQQRDVPAEWNPFPDMWIDPDLELNRNCLGFWPLEKLHLQSISELHDCTFENSTDQLGRICYSSHVMSRTDIALKLMAPKYHMSKCVFKEKENSCAFITKTFQHESIDSALLIENNGILFSPYSFGADNANKCNFYGYKRSRTENARGYCATYADGNGPADWNATRNANYLCAGQLAPPGAFVTRPQLRSNNHQELGMSGNTVSDIQEWIEQFVLVKEHG